MRKFAAFLLLLFLQQSLFALQGKEILGVWLTQEKTAKVEIVQENGKFEGKIIWLKEPLDENGKAKTDHNNPEEKLQSTPLIGLSLLKDFKFDSKKNLWKSGKIYDPENGKTYKCKITMNDEGNVLNVRGFIGVSLLGRTTEWTKAID